MLKKLQPSTGVFYFFLLGLSGFFCDGQTNHSIIHQYRNNFEDSTVNIKWMNPHTIMKDSTENYFSRTTTANPYSSGLETEIPGDLQKKNFKITVNGWIRFSELPSNNQIVISVSSNDSAIFWIGKQLTDSSAKVNGLNQFSVSCLIPRNIPSASKIKIFQWNADGKSKTDLDKIDISFSEVEFPSSLPR